MEKLNGYRLGIETLTVLRQSSNLRILYIYYALSGAVISVLCWARRGEPMAAFENGYLSESTHLCCQLAAHFQIGYINCHQIFCCCWSVGTFQNWINPVQLPMATFMCGIYNLFQLGGRWLFFRSAQRRHGPCFCLHNKFRRLCEIFYHSCTHILRAH